MAFIMENNIIKAPLLGVPHGFSTRLGGVSEGMFASMNLGLSRGDHPAHVRENFRRFCAAAGCDHENLVRTHQVHGRYVHAVGAAEAGDALVMGAPCDCDGLMTDAAGVALMIFSADCLPILLYDPHKRAVAAVHAGWRGTAAQIAAEAVRRMGEVYGTRPGDVHAAIGPGISACCFETDADVPEAMPWAAEHIKTIGAQRFSVDLKAANRQTLMALGVPSAQIAVSGDCTMCRADLFWSHRKVGGQRGSMAAVIMLPKL
jgi:uncharacterized protein, YfiH family